ncbi:MAG: hypothetical protein HC888_08190 [Candidatus Competibacteraceae bacterium]|nr:hypothetical protein [Candidatus Competibacteraceae bacterium]
MRRNGRFDRHPVLRKRSKVYRQKSTIVIPGTAARMLPLGQDSNTEDGLNPSCAVIDEYHAHPDNSMLSVIQCGMGARFQPLIWIITTAGFDLNSACYQEERLLATRILERTVEPIPENVFAIIYTLDEGDDWADEGVWIKANPNLGVSVSWSYLRDQVAEALTTPPKQNKVKTKNFNLWVQAETRWILDDVWMRGAGEVDEQALVRRPCFVALDLSASQDITAIIYAFPPQAAETDYRIVPRFFLPEDDLMARERRDHVPYTYWAEKGLLLLTAGNVIDYDRIEEQLLLDAEKFTFQEIAYDPWKAQEIVNHFTDRGFLSVLWECGGTLAAKAIADGSVQKIWAFVAPKIIGGMAASPVGELGFTQMTEALVLEQVRWESVGADLLVEAYLPPIQLD